MTVVLDSSALLAISFRERGADRALAVLPEAIMSTVNASEVVARYIDRGVPDAEATLTFLEFDLPTRTFDTAQALDAGILRRATRARGLSLGDRACLALARATGARVMTADQTWADLDLGVEIEVIR